MTSEQELLYTIKGVIASMLPADQTKVTKAYNDIKTVMDEAGDYGKIAVALLGAEMQAKEA